MHSVLFRFEKINEWIWQLWKCLWRTEFYNRWYQLYWKRLPWREVPIIVNFLVELVFPELTILISPDEKKTFLIHWPRYIKKARLHKGIVSCLSIIFVQVLIYTFLSFFFRFLLYEDESALTRLDELDTESNECVDKCDRKE